MTKIEWTWRPGTKGESWNPIRGCRAVSEGCRNCYAARQALRMAGRGQPYEGLVTNTAHGPRSTGVFSIDDRKGYLSKPLSWRSPRTVFVCSMADLFFEEVPFNWISRVFDKMWNTPQHTYIVLTKRPKRMKEYLCAVHPPRSLPWPLPNVWIGTSVEDQAAADTRIPELLATPAAVRFVSCEPLLGAVDISGYLPDLDCGDGIDWVIVGGESGPGARPMHPDWARSIRDQCQAAGVPFFFKQWGQFIHREQLTDDLPREIDALGQLDDHEFFGVGKSRAGSLLDGREWKEWPR